MDGVYPLHDAAPGGSLGMDFVKGQLGFAATTGPGESSRFGS